MWLGPIAKIVVLSAMASPTATAQPAATANLPEPVATRQTLFAIPFRITSAEQPAQEPAEVQLYVSGDRGASWQLYSKVEPSRQRFMFRAGVDGEFWFRVRTQDRSGQLRPEGSEAPEMRVIVDTMPPNLQLKAEQGQPGQITARWQIDDPHPKPGTLTIQYRTTAEEPWQAVALDPQQLQSPEGSPQTGQVTWWPTAGGTEIEIRAEVSDLAGNLAVSHAQIKPSLAAANAADVAAQSPLAARPADAAGGADGTAWPAESSTANGATTGRGGLAWDQTGGAANGGDPRATRAQGENRVAANGSAGGWSLAQGSGNQGGNAGFSPADYRNDQTPNDRYAGYRYPDTGAPAPSYGEPVGGAPSSLNTRQGLDPPAASLTSAVNPPLQNQYLPPGESQGGQLLDGLPAGQQVRMVNSPEFQLDYDLSSVGSSGVSRVELWGTQDGGRSWRRLAVDDDNRSPITATVGQAEGLYGLKLVLTSGAGLGGGEPQPGESPQLFVAVDLTMPSVRFTSAQQGTGDDSGKLVVCWQADDQRLAERPISLAFADKPDGPWTVLADGLENTGRYDWLIDRRAPQAIYLRLVVRDQAGNVAVCETTEPISLDRFTPTAQIRAIRPIEGTSQPPTGRPAYGYR